MFHRRVLIAPHRRGALTFTGVLLACISFGATFDAFAQPGESDREALTPELEQERRIREAQEELVQLQLLLAKQQLKEQQMRLEEQEMKLRGQRQAVEQSERSRRRQAEASRERETQAAERRQNERRQADDQRLVIFHLKHVPTNEAATVIKRVLGRADPQLAIDERMNSIILGGTAAEIEMVEQLIRELDSPVAAPPIAEKPKPEFETLQLRIIWLVGDTESDRRPAREQLDDNIIDSLDDLGIEAPVIACQPVTSLVASDDRVEPFAMTVPVQLAGSTVRLQARGEVARASDDRYIVRMHIAVEQPMPNVPLSPGRRRSADMFEGSIVTSLDHYMVLGTSVVVPAADGGSRRQQLPCAFVVHLDRARTFPE